jgi:hypothetical protein
MFMNQLKPLCTPILILFFAAGFVFVSENQAALVPDQNKKNEAKKDESKKEEKPFDQFQSEIFNILKKLDPNPKNAEEYEKTVRNDLYKIVDKFSANLRPGTGSKKHLSTDKTFVLVIAANGAGDKRVGELAEAIDDDAKIVVAIAGDGAPFVQDKSSPGAGGCAVAIARKGVIVALAGRGGVGDGAAGAAAGRGGIGAIVLNGERGEKVPNTGVAGQGDTGIFLKGGSDRGITNVKAIIDALKSP